MEEKKKNFFHVNTRVTPEKIFCVSCQRFPLI